MLGERFNIYLIIIVAICIVGLLFTFIGCGI